MARTPLAALCLAAAVLLSAGSTQGAVVDADGDVLTPPGHPGAIFDSTTTLLWLDATETQNRSLADVQSELGPGGEFEGWQLATRDQIHQLFLDADLPLTGSAWVSDLISQGRVQAFVGIFGQTDGSPTNPGTNLWHANTFDSPATIGAESVLWMAGDDRYWAGDNGTTVNLAGTAQPNFGVALVRFVSGVSENLLLNPDFDSDLSGWDNTGLASWSAEDAEGSGTSGSARLNISAASSYAIRSNCVTALPGEQFYYSSSYLIPPGQQAEGNAMIQIDWFDQDNCTGVSLGADNKTGTQTDWTTIGARVVAPGETASVKVFLFDQKSGGTGDFAVHFDKLELVVVPEPNGGWAAAMAALVALHCWRRMKRPVSG